MTSSGKAYPPEIRALLLELARESIRSVVRAGKLPQVDPEFLPPELRERRAVFVTLTKQGTLRGCIGSLEPSQPLYLAVMINARNAALHDPRFPPVTPEEEPELTIEISVLSPLRPLDCAGPEDLLRKLRPGVDGVVLEVGSRRATFLPQVWEKLPDPEEFLEQLSLKAGLPPDGWADPKAKVSIYQVESFSEDEPE